MRGMNNPLRKVIPYSARAKELSFFTQNATPSLGWPIRVWAGRKCAFLHWSMLFCAFSILLHLLPLIPWDWPVLLSKRHLYCHCLTFLFKLSFKEAVRALFFYCLGRTLRQCVLFVCVLGANYEGKNSIIGRRTKDNFSTAKRDRALVHNVKTTPLNRSGHIFERTKTCTDPPFVFTGRAQPCNFLNGKVCKFFFGLIRLKFLPVRFHLYADSSNHLKSALHSLRGKSVEALTKKNALLTLAKICTHSRKQNWNRIGTDVLTGCTGKKILPFENLLGPLSTGSL